MDELGWRRPLRTGRPELSHRRSIRTDGSKAGIVGALVTDGPGGLFVLALTRNRVHLLSNPTGSQWLLPATHTGRGEPIPRSGQLRPNHRTQDGTSGAGSGG